MESFGWPLHPRQSPSLLPWTNSCPRIKLCYDRPLLIAPMTKDEQSEGDNACCVCIECIHQTRGKRGRGLLVEQSSSRRLLVRTQNFTDMGGVSCCPPCVISFRKKHVFSLIRCASNLCKWAM